MLSAATLMSPAALVALSAVAVPLETAVRGGVVETTVVQHVKCAECDGHRHKSGKAPPAPPEMAGAWNRGDPGGGGVDADDGGGVIPGVVVGGLRFRRGFAGAAPGAAAAAAVAAAAVAAVWDKCGGCAATGMVRAMRDKTAEAADGLHAVPGYGASNVVCGLCRGLGYVLAAGERCLTCDGEGVVLRDVRVEVNITAGMKQGDVIVLEELTSYMPRLLNRARGTIMEAGDVTHVVLVDSPAFGGGVWGRVRDDLVALVRIPFVDALLGGHDIVLPHPAGHNIRLPIPLGTSLVTGAVLSVKGGTLVLNVRAVGARARSTLANHHHTPVYAQLACRCWRRQPISCTAAARRCRTCW